MNEIRYTLLTDGSSDAALLPILTWLLVENGINIPIQSQWADLGRLPFVIETLQQRIELALDFYPCDLLFIHRDAERQSRMDRVEEITNAIQPMNNLVHLRPYICVIPIRMTEAWLLLNEQAIRHAAGNPSGREQLTLPTLATLESQANPKQILHDLLNRASGLKGRRLKQFPVHFHARRVAEFIDDFSQLRQLLAFAALEKDIQDFVNRFI
ncbi:MAG: DUF4276 family protein [Caldilineaceae bacterium]